MKRMFVLIFAVYGAFSAALAQRLFRIGELNAENLFDCKDAAGKDDADFLPDSERRWTHGRYWKKLQALSKALIAPADDTPMDLIALCEVENDSVLYDLTRRSALRNAGYAYLVTSGPDVRGLNVALLYQPGTFRPIQSRSLSVSSYKADCVRPTRDILHASGILQTGDTLDVFVCHFPSRRGGASQTEPYRIHAAGLLRAAIDSLMEKRTNAQIVVTGDFNDAPHDAALAGTLGAIPLKEQPAAPRADRLYNLAANKRGRYHKDVKGTYFYQGRWEQLDHIIVSGRLLHAQNGIHTTYDNCYIADYPFLLTRDVNENRIPFRTYQGPVYKGGFSDHLPLVAVFAYSW